MENNVSEISLSNTGPFAKVIYKWGSRCVNTSARPTWTYKTPSYTVAVVKHLSDEDKT